jgi:hypothetical protein
MFSPRCRRSRRRARPAMPAQPLVDEKLGWSTGIAARSSAGARRGSYPNAARHKIKSSRGWLILGLLMAIAVAAGRRSRCINAKIRPPRAFRVVPRCGMATAQSQDRPELQPRNGALIDSVPIFTAAEVDAAVARARRRRYRHAPSPRGPRSSTRFARRSRSTPTRSPTPCIARTVPGSRR